MAGECSRVCLPPASHRRRWPRGRRSAARLFLGCPGRDERVVVEADNGIFVGGAGLQAVFALDGRQRMSVSVAAVVAVVISIICICVEGGRCWRQHARLVFPMMVVPMPLVVVVVMALFVGMGPMVVGMRLPWALFLLLPAGVERLPHVLFAWVLLLERLNPLEHAAFAQRSEPRRV